VLTAWALAATLAWQAHAASPSQRPRSLAEVVELAMKDGQDYPMQPDAATRIGLPEREFPCRRLRYKQKESPDRKEHTFGVLYEKDEKGTEVPRNLLLAVGTGKKENGVITVDLQSFLMRLDGTIERAYHDYGQAGEIQTDPVKLSSKVKKQIQAELTFHTKLAFALGLRPAK